MDRHIIVVTNHQCGCSDRMIKTIVMAGPLNKIICAGSWPESNLQGLDPITKGCVERQAEARPKIENRSTDA